MVQKWNRKSMKLGACGCFKSKFLDLSPPLWFWFQAKLKVEWGLFSGSGCSLRDFGTVKSEPESSLEPKLYIKPNLNIRLSSHYCCWWLLPLLPISTENFAIDFNEGRIWPSCGFGSPPPGPSVLGNGSVGKKYSWLFRIRVCLGYIQF